MSGLRPAIDSGRRMFSSAVSIGSRLKDWNTKPMWRRRSFVSSLSGMSVMSSEPTKTRPLLGRSRPASMCMSVDLPEPDGPMTAVNWPTGTLRLTPRSACTADSPSPYWRASRVAATAISVAARAAVAVLVSMGSFSGGQTGHAASRPRREMAWVSAPADSSALVASAIRRPVRPLPERTEIEARTSLPAPLGARS